MFRIFLFSYLKSVKIQIYFNFWEYQFQVYLISLPILN